MTKKAGKKRFYLLGEGYLEFPDNSTACLITKGQMAMANKFEGYFPKLLKNRNQEGQKVKIWIERVG